MTVQSSQNCSTKFCPTLAASRRCASVQPQLVEFASETVADEMETRRKRSTLSGIGVVTPKFIENWSLDEEEDITPFLTSILIAAAQTERAKAKNKKKKPDKMCKVVTQQLLYQSSNRSLAFQAEFGLFLWSTGCARQTIDALFRCGLSVCYDSVLNLIESVAEHCMTETVATSNEPHSYCYDNMNISTSIHVEQRGAIGPSKVTSGTFCVLYLLRNAKWEHMLIAPIMKRFYASKGLHFNRDIKPPVDHLHSYHDQLVVTVIQCLGLYVEGFEDLAKDPLLQHLARRPIPVGYISHHTPARASTIEEATTRGNLLFHDEIYINQLRRTPESLSKYAIPGFHDQLTNAQIFQLGFGLFHLCLNLVWGILHVHRGSINELGSLTYFFALIEKVRLGNEQPDYHSLLAALTQVAHGLLFNAWLKECGFPSLETFAQSKPTPETLRIIAARILTNYATPMTATGEESLSDDESTASDSESDTGASTAPKPNRPTPTLATSR
ncbi:hypothetical protein B0H16DRAFT_1327137 [Mycena metata]|uniref:DUF6589 domain-containing protein n=1 Tax=Mycena metata TaxID=1033252 RepID=A0AAD7I5D5_9AGAR|nr:hypothetical protein B0H16DRAFT_1327137 [Mycena metata]